MTGLTDELLTIRAEERGWEPARAVDHSDVARVHVLVEDAHHPADEAIEGIRRALVSDLEVRIHLPGDLLEELLDEWG